MEEKISIIIPVYNVEKYISKCLTSVINQTYKNLEIIVLIDGSQDDSEKIAKEFAQKDSRIKLIIKENEGLLKTRIIGLKNATGKYIFNLDSDDWIEEEAMEKLFKIANKYNADIVRGSAIREYAEVEKSKVMPAFYTEETYIEKKDFKEKMYGVILKTSVYNYIWGQLIKRNVIDTTNLDTSIDMLEDLNFNLEIYSKIQNIVFIPDIIYHYRYNPNSITKRTEQEYVYKKVSDIGKVYYKLLNYLKNWKMDILENKKLVAMNLLKAVNSQTYLFIRKNENKTKTKEYIMSTMDLPELEYCRNIITIDDIKKEKESKLLEYFYKKNFKKYYNKIRRIIYPKMIIKENTYNLYIKLNNLIKRDEL